MTDPYTPYYLNQAGNGLPVFTGARTQRGHGLGSIFGGLAKMVLPLAKRVLPVVKRHAVKTGMRIARDVMKGNSLKKAARKRVLEAGADMLDDVVKRPRRSIKQARRGRRVISRRGRSTRQNSDIFS